MAYRPKKLPRILTDEEYQSILGTFSHRWDSPFRNYLIIRIMAECGLRIGEVVALKTEHIDLNSGRLRVVDGKGSKDRVVWANQGLCEEIQEWIGRKTESDLLFPTRNGTMLDKRYFRHVVDRAAEDVGLDPSEVSPHSFRHLFATRMLEETGRLDLVQQLLGHESIETTTMYLHVAEGDAAEASRNVSWAG